MISITPVATKPTVEVSIHVPPEPKGIGSKQAKAAIRAARSELTRHGFKGPFKPSPAMWTEMDLPSPMWDGHARREAQTRIEEAFGAIANSGVLRQAVDTLR